MSGLKKGVGNNCLVSSNTKPKPTQKRTLNEASNKQEEVLCAMQVQLGNLPQRTVNSKSARVFKKLVDELMQ